MKTIYFVRHGETDANVAGIVSGAQNDVPLNENGRLQAKKAGKALKDKSIELVVCSPMSRTVETAELIAKEIGYRLHKIVRIPQFIERDCGIYEGKSEKPWFEDIANDNLHSSVETTEQMYERVALALETLQDYKEDKILVVSHGGTSRVVQGIKQNLHHSKFYELEKISNGEIYEFSL